MQDLPDMTTRYELDALTKKDLLLRLKALVGKGCRLTADVLAHIGETDARQLYLDAACSSMFTYCTSRLLMSEGEAYNRIEAARVARRFPIIFEHVASGALHLTAVRLLAPRLTQENHRELLTAAKHLSKREVEQLIADRFPRPDVATSFRKLPAGADSAGPASAASSSSPPSSSDQGSHGFSPTAVGPRAEVKPLSAERYSLRVTLSRATRDKLLVARDRLRHRLPGGAIDAIIDRALDALLRELEQQQFAKTDRPRKNARRSKEGSRHVPNSVKRVVAARDGYQCTFVDDEGRRCQERGFLEFDHVLPYAQGGASQRPADLRLRCRAHNQHAAVQAFGAPFMERKIAEARARRRSRGGELVPERVPVGSESVPRKRPARKPARDGSSSGSKTRNLNRGSSA